MYEKTIEHDIEKKIIKVTVSVKRRKKATQEKFRFYSDPFSLIEDRNIKREDYKLISSPSLTISNINDKIKYIQTGTWIYKKNEVKRAKTRKTTNRRTRSRKAKNTAPSNQKEENQLFGTEELERMPLAP